MKVHRIISSVIQVYALHKLSRVPCFGSAASSDPVVSVKLRPGWKNTLDGRAVHFVLESKDAEVCTSCHLVRVAQEMPSAILFRCIHNITECATYSVSAKLFSPT